MNLTAAIPQMDCRRIVSEVVSVSLVDYVISMYFIGIEG
jgi:hypothetical protein